MVQKKLEELSIIDDFLFHEMMSRENEGEAFCKVLLEAIFDRPFQNVKIHAQRKIQGRGTGAHGIIIDAYIEASPDTTDANLADVDIFDIEPNQYEEGSHPKRGRYYHALIDSKLLKSGVKYKNMKNATIIMILPYDPFGKNRMVYTIANQCLEDSTVEYEDGLKTIYLYTKGKIGNTSQKLHDMLKYIEESTFENAVNDELKNIHKWITEIKQDEEVGISYMKSWEIEEHIREKAWTEGHAKARTEGIHIFIDFCRELKMSDNEIAGKLSEKFEVSLEEAKSYITKI